MQKIIVGLMLASVALAGCFGGTPEKGVFSYTAPENPRDEPFHFTANVAGDRYVWDFGDGRPTLEGESVSHLFAAHGGTTLVSLTVHDGETVREFDPVRIEIGASPNDAPQLALDVAWDWVQVGEPLVLSGAASEDPNGDEVIFSWTCRRESDITAKTDSHPEVGVGYGNKPDVPVRIASGIGLPVPSRVISGDFCSNLAEFGVYSADHTISGSFDQPGIYRISMLGKDAASGSKLGEWKIYVTEVPRPNDVTRFDFSGNLALPSVGVVEPDPTGSVSFYDVHNFSIPFDGVGMRINVDPDGGEFGQNITYDLLMNGKERVAERFTDMERVDDWLKAGDYSLRVFLRSGADVDYSVDIEAIAKLDPTQFWAAPH